MKVPFIALSIASVLAVPAAYADQHGGNALDSCVKAAFDKQKGKIVSLRSEIEKGNSQFELDIKGEDGKIFEVECDAKTGKLLETEGEVPPGDKSFTGKAKLSLDAALKIALAKYPGSVQKIEYEIEDDGVAYEFDILTKDGKLIEIEVDADNGKMASPEEVLYQIGS